MHKVFLKKPLPGKCFSLHQWTRLLSVITIFFLGGCGGNPEKKNEVIVLDPKVAAERAQSIEQTVNTEMAEGLTIKLWASDSLVADPVSIHVDENGALFYTRTNRQKNSEFEIRGHQDWEEASIGFKNVDDRSKFLKTTLSPENSASNEWLKDLNKDGSHDWRDLTVEHEEIYKIDDRDGDGLAEHAELILRDFHTEVTDVAGAIMTLDKDLYIGVSPDLWRISDVDGDGVYDKKVSISNGYGVHIGFGGHGMSGLEMGPDGKIYWQIGDLGFVGKDSKGNLHDYPNTGVIVRSNPDGSDFEVFAYGNRNTHEFVFDDYGNLITVDNDGDHPGESERLVYVVDGADLGWRINWQFGKYRDPESNRYKVWMDEKMYVPHFEGQAAYIVPPLMNFVNGPTGMLYNPGTALSKEWKNCFFVGEFVGNPTQSGIHSFKLRNKGASFELYDHKPLIKGILATGVDFGPDGAMYVADWIQGWNTKNFGRIWKLDVSQVDVAARNETKELLVKDFQKSSLDELAVLLKHDDRRVRQKAQFELVKREGKGFEVFQKTLKQKEHQLARVHSIWGIVQLSRKNAEYANTIVSLLTDEDPEIRAQAARWLGDLRFAPAASALMPLLSDGNDRVKFFAAEALGRLKHSPATEPIIELLRQNDGRDVYLRHAGSLALARIGAGDKLVALAKDPSGAVRIAAVVALRRMNHAGVAAFLGDKDELVVTEAARAINDDTNITEALPALGNVLTKTTFKNEALIRRTINANLEVGSAEALNNLLAYSQRNDAPVAMRLEAISALSTWKNPSAFDRVDGRHLAEIKRDLSSAEGKVSETLVKLSSNTSSAIRVEAIRAIGKLTIKSADAVLLARVQRDPAGDVRVEALRTLTTLNSGNLEKAVMKAFADKELQVRTTALSLLSKTSLKPEEKVSLLKDIIRNRTVGEKQSAIIAIGELPEQQRVTILEELMTQAEQSKLPVEVNVEFQEAVKNSKSAKLQERFEKLRQSAPDTLFFSYQGTMFGGNADKGKHVFFRNENAQCLRCHSFDDLGGNAGPRLNGVGSRLTRQELLEALITPSKRIAEGFGVVNLELKNGSKISGLLQSEKPDAFVVKPGQRADTTIMKAHVAKSTLSGSSMPPMYLLLTKKEIRDLISFLESLKTN